MRFWRSIKLCATVTVWNIETGKASVMCCWAYHFWFSNEVTPKWLLTHRHKEILKGFVIRKDVSYQKEKTKEMGTMVHFRRMIFLTMIPGFGRTVRSLLIYRYNSHDPPYDPHVIPVNPYKPSLIPINSHNFPSRYRIPPLMECSPLMECIDSLLTACWDAYLT